MTPVAAGQREILEQTGRPLTGQKGDAPQAAALIEGLAAEVVMADAAYDADHLRQAIAATGALAVIPNNPSRAIKYPRDKHLYAQRHLIECCCSFAALPPASKRRPETSSPSSLSQPPSCGCGKCPQDLEVIPKGVLALVFRARPSRDGFPQPASSRMTTI
jgi:transposase